MTPEHRLTNYQGLGQHGYYYTVRCEVLKDMGDGRLKVRAYGRNNSPFSRIRYVPKYRVHEVKPKEQP